MQSVKRRVLIVDDHALVRKGMSKVIEGTPDLELCGEAEGVQAGIQLIDELKPDIVVLDLSLPDGDGIELIKRVRKRNAKAKMLVSSVHSEMIYAERAVRAGAHGYVSKDASADELLKAIRDVLSGEVSLSREVSNRMLVGMSDHDDEDEDVVGRLSDRELQVFTMLGEGMTTKYVAEKLCLSPKTVETHQARIREKLNLNNAQELREYAIKWGAHNRQH